MPQKVRHNLIYRYDIYEACTNRRSILVHLTPEMRCRNYCSYAAGEKCISIRKQCRSALRQCSAINLKSVALYVVPSHSIDGTAASIKGAKQLQRCQ